MKKVLVIAGPTGIGKTSLSIEIAKQIPSEIISGDSMQIYKKMDIGTGKVTEEEKEGIPHYMIDIKDVWESFSVAEFQQKVNEYIQYIHDKGKTPIIVGGTGLYIQSVLYDFSFQERKRSVENTKLLENRLQIEGNDVLYKELMNIDKEYASSFHPNNTQRLIRALEVYMTTGMLMSELHNKENRIPKYDHYIIGLEMNRIALYEQINRRVDQMITTGLVDEVNELYQQGYKSEQGMKAIGYKEIIQYLEGQLSLDEAIELLKRNSRRYAKRQYTYFRNKMDIHWYQVDHDKNLVYERIINDCRSFLK